MLRTVLLFVFLIAIATAAVAETPLSGTVSDPQGKAVPGSLVNLLRGETGVAEIHADATGRFTLPNVAAGNYRITADAAGFAPVAKDVAVLADQRTVADLRFAALESQTQSIVISAKTLEPALDLRN